MEKTLPELVEVLKSRGLDYAVYNWTAQDRFSEWFEAKVYFTLGDKFVSSKEIFLLIFFFITLSQKNRILAGIKQFHAFIVIKSLLN